MKKPNGYDDAREIGSFIPVDLGGHYAVIKQVTEKDSQTGKEMIVVLFDFCKPDKQPDYFSNAFREDNREDKKWPYNGSKYIMVHDYQDSSKTSRQFKTFCTCVEKSNNFDITWGGSDWGKQFKGKKIGIVFGEEEHEYEGKISMRRVPKWFVRFDKVAEAEAPAPKYIDGAGPKQAQKESTDSEFMTIPEGADDEIPF